MTIIIIIIIMKIIIIIIIMVLKVTFNNISVISWRSFLLIEETGVPGKNHRRSAASR
jgi:hypothetical protein